MTDFIVSATSSGEEQSLTAVPFPPGHFEPAAEPLFAGSEEAEVLDGHLQPPLYPLQVDQEAGQPLQHLVRQPLAGLEKGLQAPA